ncbi:hypothetical protein H4582DRAFT_2056809 [Lactarius indigo]|nr:hypothetical protein H4582DRAFT_2056809 [Lactarius indigo]
MRTLVPPVTNTGHGGALFLLAHLTLTLRSGAVVGKAVSTNGGEEEDLLLFDRPTGTRDSSRLGNLVREGLSEMRGVGSDAKDFGPTEEVACLFLIRRELHEMTVGDRKGKTGYTSKVERSAVLASMTPQLENDALEQFFVDVSPSADNVDGRELKYFQEEKGSSSESGVSVTWEGSVDDETTTLVGGPCDVAAVDGETDRRGACCKAKGKNLGS